jgi:hypothetical protein
MTRLGADPDDLRRLAGALRRAADGLDVTATRTGHRLRAARWTGTDAGRSVSDWDRRHRPTLVGAATACRRAAADLDRQAVEQTVAAGPAGPRATAPSAFPTAPERTETFTGTLSVGAGPVAVTTGMSATVERVPGPTDRVVVTEDADGALGATASSGAWLAVDGAPMGGGAAGAVSAALGAVRRRSWEVPDGEVTGLLGAVALSRVAASHPVTGVLDRLRPVVWGPATVDRPHRTEELVTVELRAAGHLAGPGIGAAALAEGSWSIGHGRDATGASLLIEHEGRGSVATRTALLAVAGLPAGGVPSVDLRTQVRLHLAPPSADGARQVLVTLQARAGDTVERIESVLWLDPHRDRGTARRLAALDGPLLAAGDAGTAVAALLDALAAGPSAVSAVDTRVLTGGITDRTIAAGGGTVAVVGAEGSGTVIGWREVARVRHGR